MNNVELAKMIRERREAESKLSNLSAQIIHEKINKKEKAISELMSQFHNVNGLWCGDGCRFLSLKGEKVFLVKEIGENNIRVRCNDMDTVIGGLDQFEELLVGVMSQYVS